MKKITNLLIVCSLALAGAVMAQQPSPEEQQPSDKKQKTEKKAPAAPAPAEVKPKAQAPKTDAPAAPKTEVPAPKTDAPSMPKPETPAVKEPAAPKQPAALNEAPPQPKVEKKEKKAPADRKPAPATTPETKAPVAPDQPAASVPPVDKKQKSAESKKDKKAPAADANASMTPATSVAPIPPARTKPAVSPVATAASTTPPAAAATTPPAAAATTPPAAAATTPPASAAASTAPAATAAATAAPSVAQTSPTTSVNPAVAAKKPDAQKVEQIRQRHANFSAQPRPDRVPPVTFSAGYRIQGADQWQGPRYEVYRSYRPERHDQSYYRSRYTRVELIAGGYYYFHNNYWYPAWGYSPREEYYAYDAPIYAGKRALPPDKVIAEVQAVLQEMGYYRGEVDGLLGPLTREALTGYQRDNGMQVTAVIDEPTLDSLNMG